MARIPKCKFWQRSLLAFFYFLSTDVTFGLCAQVHGYWRSLSLLQKTRVFVNRRADNLLYINLQPFQCRLFLSTRFFKEEKWLRIEKILKWHFVKLWNDSMQKMNEKSLKKEIKRLKDFIFVYKLRNSLFIICKKVVFTGGHRVW